MREEILRVIVKCDGCGAVIDSGEGGPVLKSTQIEVAIKQRRVRVDLCEQCYEPLKRLLTNGERLSPARLDPGIKDERPTRSSAKASLDYQAKEQRTERLRQVREWANANGYEVSTHGKVPTDVMRAYLERAS